jgi:hypothetical protein
MPFVIEKQPKGGFKVKDIHTGHKFSNRSLPKQIALKQRVAIALSEHKKNPNKPVSYWFK